ncbi:MAG TPA: hypothetical protein VGI42_03745 [Chthoniobacterales bacterium]
MLMNKAGPSRARARQKLIALTALFFLSLWNAIAALQLTAEETRRIGKKIWQNECNGTLSGLTSWNAGENFASLGIGHFIWYPENARGPFDESFPKLIDFITARGVTLPEVARAKRSCPWNSRAEFERASQTPRMKELRQFLASTVHLQAEFLVQRLEQALPKMLASAPTAGRPQIQAQFERVLNSPGGAYALVDYVNFKGEGVLVTERYEGQGWGLLQVLEGMREINGANAVKEFADSAKKTLATRVRNSPPERHEERWLAGWLSRINTYAKS